MIALLFVAAAFAAPQLSDRIQVTKVFGPPDVHVKLGMGGKEKVLHASDDLFVGDEVTVLPKQVVSLAAFDGSTWRLAPGTHFTAEARKPDKVNLSYWSFGLAQGAMWGKVTKDADAKEGFRLKVRTKTAALGIRGTEYLLETDSERSAIDVIEGTVWWGTDPLFAAGTYQMISAGHHGEIGADGHVNVSESKGDLPKLLRDYGIGLPDDAKKATGSAADCLALGKGWRSDNGSSVGECTDP